MRIEPGASIDGSILMDDVVVERGAVLHNVILDKNVVVPSGVSIGVDLEHDAARGFTVSPAGIVAVAKGATVEP